MYFQKENKTVLLLSNVLNKHLVLFQFKLYNFNFLFSFLRKEGALHS